MGIVRLPREDRVDGTPASDGPDHGRPSCDGPRRGRPCVRPTTAITCQRPSTRTACRAATRRSFRPIRPAKSGVAALTPLRPALSAHRTTLPPPAALPALAYDPWPMRSRPRRRSSRGTRADAHVPLARDGRLPGESRREPLERPSRPKPRRATLRRRTPGRGRAARPSRTPKRTRRTPRPEAPFVASLALRPVRKRAAASSRPDRRFPFPAKGPSCAGQVPSVAPRSECRRIAPPNPKRPPCRAIREDRLADVPRLWDLPSTGSPRRAPRCGRLGFRNDPGSEPLEPPVGRSARTTSPIHPFAN